MDTLFFYFFLEMSTIALDVARKTNGGYTIVPCCIRDNVFGVKTKSSYNRWKMSDADNRSFAATGGVHTYGGHPYVSAHSNPYGNWRLPIDVPVLYEHRCRKLARVTTAATSAPH